MHHSFKSRAVRTAFVSLAGAVLAGCTARTYAPLAGPAPATTVSKKPGTATEIVVLSHEPAPVIGLDNVDTEPPSAQLATNAIPARPSATVPGRGWISLRAWSEQNASGPPEKIVSNGATSYRLTTRNGSGKITIGSRLAQWNGVAVWLGFAPQLVHGEPHLHALDTEKTLQPLAGSPPALAAAQRTIVLDPGHGGADGGTRGAHNQLEKNFALDWALRTERLLTNAGWKVFLTRRGDVDLPLAERISFADRVHADLFISLHFNSAWPQTQPSGIETFCLTPGGMPSTLARGFADDERAIFPNNAFDAANLAWAFRIHRSLVAQTHARDDGVKRARFMSVLRHQNRPAILVEGGFLSNASDAARISSTAYRESLARAVAEALK